MGRAILVTGSEPEAVLQAETNQLRAAVWKKRKRDEKGSGSGEDDEGGGEMIVHVPKAVEKRIKACVLMGPELGNMTVTKALAVEGLQRGLEEAHIGSSSMFILTNRFIPGLVWHNFWHLPLQPCVARAGCCGRAPVRGACAILSAAFRVDWW